jgi:hypothetical protein
MMAENEETLGNQSPLEGNDDIPSSAREALGGVAADTPPQVEPDAPLDIPEEPDEPTDIRERSKLGRKVSMFEQEITGLKQTISQLNTLLTQRDVFTDRALPSDDKSPVEYITTPEDLERYEAWRDEQRTRQRSAYANRYVHTIKNLTHFGSDMHAEIENELLTNVGEYPTYSKYGDPAGDAEKNYVRAENKLLKMKLAGSKPQPNVRGGSPLPTGVSANTRVNAPSKASIKLDEYASKFLKNLGESEDSEWVQRSLGEK